ncbi:hypothetical protein B0G80_5058 [Paraburkholderia sp. BL6669N2]|uniref:hypothetical protein n=1 Tax=Paraburkholderia sp. BL6669N2 TaxID=1938807 RepID=UPI000E3B006A|nr:hypothetical protein [Paraburkholderia sp. BL6669N2]REG48769.1 hypothetical protein B0G80_5058 [Paraburkholderia sp. BL6669N2]
MRYSGGSKGYARRVALSMRQFAIGLRRGGSPFPALLDLHLHDFQARRRIVSQGVE